MSALASALIAFPLYGFSIIYKDQKSPLDGHMMNHAYQEHKSLNSWQHFNTERIKKDAELQREVFEQENSHKIQIIGLNDQVIHAIFVDRGSDKVIVLGQGFHARKEYLLPFLKIFPEYDLLFFDYHGHRELIRTYLQHGRKTLNTYFIEPQKTVSALVAFLRLQKEYTAVIGLGMCYSGLIFCGAQAASDKKNIALFDKLILDSSIESLREVVFQVFKDPLLCCSPKTGGAPKFVQWVLSTAPVRFFARALGWVLLGRQFSSITTSNYLKQIHVPILYIGGEDDKFATSESAMRIYNSCDKELCCLVSLPCQHTLNHIKHKELYAHLAYEFINASSTHEFVSRMV